MWAKNGQLWFTIDRRQIRREFHQAQSEQLRCIDQMKRMEKRLKYIAKRRAYKGVVMRAEIICEGQSCIELEKVVNNPKKWCNQGGLCQAQFHIAEMYRGKNGVFWK